MKKVQVSTHVLNKYDRDIVDKYSDVSADEMISFIEDVILTDAIDNSVERELKTLLSHILQVMDDKSSRHRTNNARFIVKAQPLLSQFQFENN